MSMAWGVVHAEIQTDGTVGPALSLEGPSYLINAELGSQSGNNLFHSFQSFNLNSSESATFTGPDSIQNIISRVTGGEASSIDGLLQSQVGQADFYFLNPAGVMFGPNAQVDVPAAFHVSTADGLIFADGQSFSAIDPSASSLSIEAPSGFNFLATQPAEISINGASLSFQPGSTVSLSAGSLTIAGNGPESQTLISPEGDISLITTGEQKGPLTIDSAQIDVSGNGGGQLTIEAGASSIDNSFLWSDNLGIQHASQGIDIFADSLSLTSSVITADTLAEGNAGSVQIQINGLLGIRDGTWISSSTAGPGNSGQVALSADQLTIEGTEELFSGIVSSSYQGAEDAGDAGDAGEINIAIQGHMDVLATGYIGSDTYTSSNGGNINIYAGSAYVEGLIASTADTEASGNAGNVSVTVDDLLEVVGGGQITSLTFSSGNAGTVSVSANQLILDGLGSYIDYTTIASSAQEGASGNAGTVDITVTDLLAVLERGAINSNTYGSGNGGDISIRAGILHLSGSGSVSSSTTGAGNAGTVMVEANELYLNDFSDISTLTYSDGDAGAITVKVADFLAITELSEISSSSGSNGETGNAGTVSVTAPRIYIDDGDILSEAGYSSSGNAGIVDVNADTILVLLDGSISSNTHGVGKGGAVNIETTRLYMDNGNITSEADFFRGTGDGGTISVTVGGLLEMYNNSHISSSTASAGDAGEVTVSAYQLLLVDSSISSEASFLSTGHAKSVTVNVEDILEILNGGRISSLTYESGNAGTVTVSAGQIHMDGWNSSITSEVGYQDSGNAGTVTVNVDGLLDIQNGAEISSSTGGSGNAGSVTINAGKVQIDSNGYFYDEEYGWIGTPSQISSDSTDTGNVGDIIINAGIVELGDGGDISISTSLDTIPEEELPNYSTGTLIINADDLYLSGDSSITSHSFNNLPASDISITANRLLVVEGGASIDTSTWGNDGGSINIQGGALLLQDGEITTSVSDPYEEGQRPPSVSIEGNGGNINIQADALAMDTGFIQANTDATGASGGTIHIDTPFLLTHNALPPQVGGDIEYSFEARSGLNVIQAAAPGGESGEINLGSPELDISASVLALDAESLQTARLAQDPCLAFFGEAPSSLAQGGRGGIPVGLNRSAPAIFTPVNELPISTPMAINWPAQPMTKDYSLNCQETF